MKKALVFLAVPALALWTAVASAAPNKSFTVAKDVLPADIQVIGSSNLKSIKSTQTFQKLFPQLVKSDRDVAEGLDKVKKSCGIDPVNAIEDVTVGVADKEKGLILVTLTGVTEQKLIDCASKIAKAETGETVTTKKTGDIIELKSNKGGQSLYVAFLKGDVLAFASDPTDKALLERFLGGKGAITKGSLAPFMAKLAFDSALSLAWSKQMPLEKWSMKGGTLDVAINGGNVSASTAVKLGSSKEASEVAAMAQKELAKAQGNLPKELDAVAKTLTVKASGDDVVASASATERDLAAMLNLVLRGGGGGASSSSSAPMAPRR
jgi:hypothetical protein